MKHPATLLALVLVRSYVPRPRSCAVAVQTRAAPSAAFFFSSRRLHTRLVSDWSSDVCSSDLTLAPASPPPASPDCLPNNLPGFPETVAGEIVFCDADWISTDAIYPGKFTYQDDVAREKMAEV